MDENKNDKQSVLEQVESINSILTQSRKFMPYDYNALILWGIISSILFMFTDIVIINYGVSYGVMFLLVFLVLGFLIESLMIKKENKKFELDQFTEKQKFIEMLFTFASFFSIVLTVVFIQNSLMEYIYTPWIFMIGFIKYIIGFILNDKRFLFMGKINMAVFFLLLICSGFMDILLLSKYCGVIFLGGSCIYLGIKCKQDCKLV
jgi:hypothetical protein